MPGACVERQQGLHMLMTDATAHAQSSLAVAL